LKPNERECQKAIRTESVPVAVAHFCRKLDRPVFCTAGERGILLGMPGAGPPTWVPAYPVSGPIDPVGAGDSTSAGIACAAACGASLAQAAAFGNLIASITVQQLGTTGTATPEQVRQRWREVSDAGGVTGG